MRYHNFLMENMLFYFPLTFNIQNEILVFILQSTITNKQYIFFKTHLLREELK